MRQLSTKARRNCSNIGVAQVVAASWSNNSASGLPPAAAAAAASSAAAAAAATPVPAPPVELKATDEAAVIEGIKDNVNVQLGDLSDPKTPFWISDGSIAVHAGISVQNSCLFLRFLFSIFSCCDCFHLLIRDLALCIKELKWFCGC